MNKTRKLKLYNGRFYRIGEYGTGFFYAGAYSVKDAISMMGPFSRWKVTLCEANKYWNKNAWGNSMDGINQERGLWLTKGHFNHDEKPERVV